MLLSEVIRSLSDRLAPNYQKYIKLNQNTLNKRSIRHKDTGGWHDYLGSIWLACKRSDAYTLIMAALHGMMDKYDFKSYGGDRTTDYYDTLSVDDKKLYLELFKKVNTYSGHENGFTRCFNTKNQVELFYKCNLMAYTNITELINDLYELMNTGRVKVYRGISITRKRYLELCKKDKLLIYNPNRILKYVDNTTKKFNSFSTDPKTAKRFSLTQYTNSDEYYGVIVEGIADRSDINWAFTAYLRIQEPGEKELNINNGKVLKDMRVYSSNLPIRNVDRFAEYEGVNELNASASYKKSIVKRLSAKYGRVKELSDDAADCGETEISRRLYIVCNKTYRNKYGVLVVKYDDTPVEISNYQTIKDYTIQKVEMCNDVVALLTLHKQNDVYCVYLDLEKHALSEIYNNIKFKKYSDIIGTRLADDTFVLHTSYSIIQLPKEINELLHNTSNDTLSISTDYGVYNKRQCKILSFTVILNKDQRIYKYAIVDSKLQYIS